MPQTLLVLALVLLQAGVVAHATKHVGSPADSDSLLHADEVCSLCVAQAGLDQSLPVVYGACQTRSVSPAAPPESAGRFYSLHFSPFQPRGPPVLV